MTRIYVGNLSHTIRESDLRHAFGRLGDVSEVTIPTDRRTGRPRGFGVVEMPKCDEAAAAIRQLNQARIGGRPLAVREVGSKTRRARKNAGPRGKR